jgi:arylamine N-acetyltransferase
MSEHELAVKKFIDHFSIDFNLDRIELLTEIQKKFCRIPYENITKIIKSFELSDPELKFRYPQELIDDHIKFATGGTCFSLVYYLRQILDEMGFLCETCMADMNYGANIHCAIVVTLGDERFLVDPGYLITSPVKLPVAAPVIHETSSNSLRIESCGTHYNVHTIEHGQQKWRYRLKMNPVNKELFKKFWNESFSYNMMNSLMISRADENSRLYFRKNRFSQISRRGKHNTNVQGQEAEFARKVFGFDRALVHRALKILEEKREFRSHGSTDKT